ncbi:MULTISPECIES: hypothetical protein [unclassified Streptomyces]|uniref:hypothetical protein n=1 Tax=unclassified Streptomyces TaxID=2593676 RepID=UPI00382931F8
MTRPTEDEENRLRLAFALIGEAVGDTEAAGRSRAPDASGESVRSRGAGRSGQLAGASADVPPAAGPLRLPHRRTRTVVLAAAAACAVALLVGVAVATRGGSPAPSTPSSDTAGLGQNFPELLACSTTIVEGTLEEIRPAGDGRVRVTLSVDRWLKPGDGAGTLTLDLADPAARDPLEAYRQGRHVLMVIPSDPERIATTFPLQGQDIPTTRDRVARTLPEVTAADCPPAFRPPTASR